MNLRKVDLNLLVIFDALMQERNVTKAASRVALSQPAFSNALSRLRHYLKDDLFVRSPDGMLPTPRARELEPYISGVITTLQSALEPTDFDPHPKVYLTEVRLWMGVKSIGINNNHNPGFWADRRRIGPIPPSHIFEVTKP